MHSKLLCSITALVALTSTGACGSGNSDPGARGSASTSWMILRDASVTTCARVGATSVSLLLHNRGTGEGFVTSFACTASQGTTPSVPVGTYDATLALHAADGFTLSTAPMQAAIVAAGQITALQPGS